MCALNGGARFFYFALIFKFKLELGLVVLGLEMTANSGLKINSKSAGTNLALLENVVLEHLVPN